MKQSQPKIEKLQKVVQSSHNNNKEYATRRITEPKPNQKYINKDMLAANYKLVHNRSLARWEMREQKFKTKHTYNNYEQIHNILHVWKHTYEDSENILQLIQPPWISMEISARSEEDIYYCCYKYEHIYCNSINPNNGTWVAHAII